MTTLTRLTASLSDRYRLERELGQGGMATVYLAEDLKHSRKVAIKVLHPELSALIGGDRFLTEIKVTANLQHPHILGLIDSGAVSLTTHDSRLTDDSRLSTDLLYYVMPYVSGESLRSRLSRDKQLPIDEALRLAKEVASALDYAHRQGVVHRDIKPENILLQDGSALVADFGIALAVQQAGGSRMTQTGMSLGTPAYMSPEQAMGERDIGARSDVYALGAMTYEMLTGEPPFMGANSQAIVAKVLTETPRPLRLARPNVSPAVEAAVLTALQKLPADRFGSAKEFADALDGKGTGAGYAATVVTGATRPSRLTRPTRPVMLAAIALTAAAAGLAGWLAHREPARPVLRYTTLLPEDQALANTRGHRIAISPDGSRLVYAGHGPDGSQLWLRNRNQLRATLIPGASRATVPFFSPDGQRVGYTVEGNTEIKVVALTGAPPITVADSGIGADGGTWSADGFIYFDGLTGGGTTGLVRVAPNGAKVLEQVTTVDTARGEQDHFWPNALPKGRGILFTIQSRGNNEDRSELAVLDTKTMKVHTLVQAITGRYAPGGYLLYVTAAGELLAVKFDLDRLQVTGEPFAIASGIERRSFGAIDLAISMSGTLVYRAGGAAMEPSQVVYVNRDGSIIPVDTNFVGEFQTLALSPDGRRLAVSKIEGTEQQVWIKQLPDGPLSKLTFEGNRSVRPTWSPDGQYVGFIGNQGLGPQFYRKRADGTGQTEPVLTFPGRVVNEAQWSRDGNWVAFRTNPSDIFARRTTGDTSLVPLVHTSFEEISPSLSPDGRWLAYSSNESGTFEIYVRPFPDAGSARWQVSNGTSFEPLWTPDSRELVYWSGGENTTGQLQTVAVLPGPTFVAGQRHTLPIQGSPFVGAPGSWDITRDGKRFVMIRQGAGKGEERELVVVENLPAELTAQHAP